MNPPTLNRHKKASILVAEDEAIVRADVEEYLKSFGYRVAASVASGEDAKRLATNLAPDLVLMDIVLDGKVDGIEAGKYIQKKLGIPVVFATAHGDEHTLERAKLNAPFGYVLKPFNDRELRTAIEIAIFRHRTEDELRRHRQWLKAILDSMDEGVVVTDKWGLITLFNERAVALTGWNSKKALGKPLGQVVRLLDKLGRDPIAPSLSEFFVEPATKRNHDQALLVTAKGTELPVQFSITPMSEPDGPINGAILKIIKRQSS
jgi:PAS domain S-box-containing protein